MTGSARYLCKQNGNVRTILWEAGRVKSEGASNHSCHQFVPSEMASPWLRMVFGFLTIFNCTHLFAQKKAYLCRLGWHSHGSQYPRNSFSQTFEFKNSWGPSSKSADSPLISSALCHYTSWIIRSIVTSVFVPITPACGKTLPPETWQKSRDPSATFGTPEQLQNCLRRTLPQISHLWQTFCSLSNPWQIFKLCCESRLGEMESEIIQSFHGNYVWHFQRHT